MFMVEFNYFRIQNVVRVKNAEYLNLDIQRFKIFQILTKLSGQETGQIWMKSVFVCRKTAVWIVLLLSLWDDSNTNKKKWSAVW